MSPSTCTFSKRSPARWLCGGGEGGGAAGGGAGAGAAGAPAGPGDGAGPCAAAINAAEANRGKQTISDIARFVIRRLLRAQRFPKRGLRRSEAMVARGGTPPLRGPCRGEVVRLFGLCRSRVRRRSRRTEFTAGLWQRAPQLFLLMKIGYVRRQCDFFVERQEAHRNAVAIRPVQGAG